MDYQKIYEALITIQEACIECGGCEHCPLSNGLGNLCRVYDAPPYAWRFNAPPEQYKILRGQ